MERQVLYRDRQELQAADLNNTQLWADEAQRNLVVDAITGERQFVGFAVTAHSATEISVAPGRLYDGSNGKVFFISQAQVHSVFAMLPLQDSKWLAVSVFGQEQDVDIQPRDFLIDLQTRQVEPQAVAMERRRVAVVHIAQGLESPTPERPEPPTGYTLIAHVRLSPTGIQEIVPATNRKLPQLNMVTARIAAAEVWQASVAPQINALRAEMAALNERTESLATREQLIGIMADLGRVKGRLDLPSTYAAYDMDGFGNTTKTDTAATVASLGYGLQFPDGGVATINLALLNPIDPTVRRYASGWILPEFTEIERLATQGQSGDVSASAYQWQTQELTTYTVTNWVYHYGWYWNYYDYWWWRWYYGYYPYWYGYWWYYGYWTSYTTTHYQLSTVTHSVNGAQIAQTFLSPSTFWLTKVGLNCTSRASSGDVLIAIVETEAGKPRPQQTLAYVTVPVAQWQTGWNDVEIGPVLLEAGKRYAILIITQGAHRLATVNGNSYTQGTFFVGTDGDYMIGDLTKDLHFRLWGARFNRTRLEVPLQGPALSGGMTDIQISAPVVQPDGTELVWEAQVGGVWRKLGDSSMFLASRPDIVPLRAVFVGSQDLMPAVRLVSNGVKGLRPATSFTHVSTTRTLAAASTDIRVQLQLGSYDDTKHTIQVRLVDGTNLITPTTTTFREQDGGVRLEARFQLSSPGLSSYKIRIDGTRGANDPPFVVAERVDVAL